MFGSLYGIERMVYIQQIFVDNKPAGLLAYLKLAPLKAVVDAMMSYIDSTSGPKDLALHLFYLNLGQV